MSAAPARSGEGSSLGLFLRSREHGGGHFLNPCLKLTALQKWQRDLILQVKFGRLECVFIWALLLKIRWWGGGWGALLENVPLKSGWSRVWRQRTINLYMESPHLRESHPRDTTKLPPAQTVMTQQTDYPQAHRVPAQNSTGKGGYQQAK